MEPLDRRQMRAFAIWNEGDPMRSDYTATSGRDELALDTRCVGSKIAKSVVFIACVIFSLLLTSVTATAHVKWFVNCNVADDPLPAMDVFTGTFFLFFAIFLVLFYLGCKFERTTLGTNISQLLDHVTTTLHRRSDDLLRSVAAVSFFGLSASQNTKLRIFRFDFLRWTVASTLLWPSMEKFVYPGWVAPIAIAHPEITLGFDVTTVVTAAGVVESGLALARPNPGTRIFPSMAIAK